jgi:hypothetical protein
MRHSLAVLLVAVFALTLGLAGVSAGDKAMPKFIEEPTAPAPRPICHPFEYWNGTMQQLGGKLIFTGPNERGDIIVIMAFPDGSFGFFNVALDGSTVCMIAAVGAANWDREFLKSRVFGDDPGRSI